MHNFAFLAFTMPGLTEWIIIAAIGLLFFGKRLPEVGRGLGRSIVEFKKGLKGIEDDVSRASEERPALPVEPAPAGDAGTAKPAPQPGYKFDPYTGKPLNPEGN